MKHVKDFKNVNDHIFSLCKLAEENSFVTGTLKGHLFIFKKFIKFSEVKKAHNG